MQRKKIIPYMKASLVSLLLLFVSSGIVAQQPISGSFNSGSETRSYLGAMPSSPQTPLRLVILFCGANEDATQMQLRGFNSHLGDNTIVIYPEPFNAQMGFGNSPGIDDFQMVEDLIHDVVSNYTIDVNDICVGGFSNGAIFTYNLVCDFNSTSSSRAYSFKAFAVVSGAMASGEANTTDCPIANELPLIAFHGTQDIVIRYDGGFVFPINFIAEATDTTLNFWATAINGCNTTPTVTALPDLVVEAQAPSTVERVEYDCSSTKNTQFYRIDGGLHAWPGGNAAFDIQQDRNRDINASELIADFFGNSTTVSVSEVKTDPIYVSAYPNPVTDNLNIETNSSLRRVEIYNPIGRKVFNSQGANSTISLEHVSPGIYLIQIETDAGITVRKIIKN